MADLWQFQLVHVYTQSPVLEKHIFRKTDVLRPSIFKGRFLKAYHIIIIIIIYFFEKSLMVKT